MKNINKLILESYKKKHIKRKCRYLSGEFECLHGIEIALDVNGQKYKRIEEWIY